MSSRGSAILVVIVVAVTLGVGTIVWGNLDGVLTGMKPGMSATANTTIDSVISNTWSAFSLNTITPIIIGSAAVLGAIALLGGRAQ